MRGAAVLLAIALCVVGVQAGSEADNCDYYCSAFATNCGSDVNAYTSLAECMQSCRAFPTTGVFGDTSGNTLQCRVYHVNASAADATTHCKHASQWGGNQAGTGCGTVCEAYCNQWVGEGTCAYHLPGTFASRTECLNSFCNNYPFAAGGMPNNGLVASGNSRECRQYHSFAAVKFNATGATATSKLHCTHATPTSVLGQCTNGTGSPSDAITDVYCENHIRACGVTTQGMAGYSPATAKWADRTQCLAVAAQMPRLGAENDQSGDTIQCRNYHANVAGSSPTLQSLHCAHSGLDGINQCGTSSCQSYCDNILAMCSSTNTQYPDLGACMLWCSALPAGAVTDMSGDTLGCRMYHLQVAASYGSGSQLRSDHCAHAGPSGTSVTSGGVATNACGTPQDAFCDVALAACNATYVQYSNKATCAMQAMAFPRVTPVPPVTSGNSLECRAYHASVALSGAAGGAPVHCWHTGAIGGLGTCGTGCEGYCSTMTYACNSTWGFANNAECMAFCATYPTVNNQMPATATAGNSLECRAYHAGVALASTGTTKKDHCAHAKAVSYANTCGTACMAYCNTWIAACNATTSASSGQKYMTWDSCISMCGTWATGTDADTSGNTLGCRQYHAGVALQATGQSKLDHCGHSFATSTAQCVGGGSSTGGNGASALQASVGLVAAAIVAAIAL